MVSLRSRLLLGWFRLSRRKHVFMDTSEFDRSITDSQRARTSQPPKALYQRHRVSHHNVRGFPCVRLSPKKGASEQHVLYLHGGAYVHSIERSHWLFIGRLVDKLGCTVTVPVYPLAPDYQCDTTLAVVEEAYARFLAESDPARQVVMGDSAGGGLTLALAQRLKEQGCPQPAHLVLISPWLDVTMRDPAVPILDRRDPYLSTPGLLEAGRMYAGDRDLSDPRISPINGHLDGLGHISVFAGTRDVLLLDARRLQRLAAAQGTSLDYFEYQGMFHGWVLQKLPEGRQATTQLVEALRTSQERTTAPRGTR